MKHSYSKLLLNTIFNKWADSKLICDARVVHIRVEHKNPQLMQNIYVE
jgi:hypothetical protein